MILIAQAIVYKRAVVVKIFDTSAADLTVEVRLSFNHFTVRAEVVKVNSLANCSIDKLYKIVFCLDIPWVSTSRISVENYAQYEGQCDKRKRNDMSYRPGFLFIFPFLIF